MRSGVRFDSILSPRQGNKARAGSESFGLRPSSIAFCREFLERLTGRGRRQPSTLWLDQSVGKAGTKTEREQRPVEDKTPEVYSAFGPDKITVRREPV
jgi:hypothetical protein